MKKLLICLLFSICGTSHAVTYQAVRASTANIVTPTLQTGTMNLSSGTITNLNATTFRATSINGSGSGITGVILNQETLQSGATFFVSSGTVNNLNVPTTLQLNGASGTTGQSIQSNGSGTIPTWVNVPAAILATTSTWTGAQSFSSPSGITNTYGITTATFTVSGATVSLNGISYKWPVAQAASTLSNNGSGILTWASPNAAPIQATVATSSVTSSATFVPTHLSASITPTTNTHRIRVTWSGNTTTGTGSGAYTIFRNGSNILDATNGSGQIVSSVAAMNSYLSYSYIDSPATASSVTYAVAFRSVSGGQTFCNNGTCTLDLEDVGP